MRAYNAVIHGLALISASLVVVVMLMVTLDVLSRTTLGYSIGWVYELTGHSMVLILMFGMPWVARQGGHVSIDVLVDLTPPRTTRFLRFSGFCIAAASSGAIAYAALHMAFTDISKHTLTSGFYPIPRAVISGSIGIGFFFTATEFVRLLKIYEVKTSTLVE